MISSLFLAAMTSVEPAAAVAQSQEIVVRADLRRAEIERILRADNVDTVRQSPKRVADGVATIRRGRAPLDFWEAYQRHVRAWEMFAELSESPSADGDQITAAEKALNRTFDEVERSARRYGARLPVPAFTIATE